MKQKEHTTTIKVLKDDVELMDKFVMREVTFMDIPKALEYQINSIFSSNLAKFNFIVKMFAVYQIMCIKLKQQKKDEQKDIHQSK